MPKTDTPGSRRSARVASKAADTAAAATAKPESKPKPKTASKAKEAAAAPAPAEKKTSKKTSSVSAKAKDAAVGTAKAPASKDKAAAAKPPSSGGRGALKEGQGLPKITLEDEDGNEVDVSGLAAEKGVVIFLYPKADTPGCTSQACGYRDVHDEIGDLGYDVYGLSKDKPAAQKKWKDKKTLNYHLLCDPESKLIRKLGAFTPPNNTKRSHFIFEKGTGKLIDIALGVKAQQDPDNVLKFLKEHHS